MAGLTFDDLGTGTKPAPSGVLAFEDLALSPEEERTQRLRKISLAMHKQFNDPGASDLFSDAYTLGLMKPVGALAESLGGELTGLFGAGPEPEATFGERWRAATGGYQDFLDEATANSGYAGTAANIAGGALTGGPGTAAMKLWPQVATAAGMGAVEGAARNSEDLGSATTGALKGGALAGTTAFALESMLRGIGPGARAERAAERELARGTDPAVLRQEATKLYDQLDNAGVAYSNTQADTLADAVRNDLTLNAGYDPQGAHAQLTGVLGRIEGLRGQPVSLNTLQQIRSQLGSNAGSGDPEVRRIAGRVMAAIDDMVTNQTPGVSTLPGDQIAPMWTEARRLWRSANTAEDIGWRLDKADLRAASTNSGQNTENAIRQNIRQAYEKGTAPRQFHPYNEAELGQMRRVVEGTPTQNALRYAGNAVAGIPGTVSALGGGLGLGLGGMVDPSVSAAIGVGAPLVAQGAGHMLKRQSANMAEDQADTLMRLITTGSDAPIRPMMGPQMGGQREQLARLLAQRSMSNYAGGL